MSLWASIAMSMSDESTCASTPSSSASSSASSSKGSFSTAASWSTASTSSTATPYPAVIITSSTLKKSLLVDYSRSSSSEGRGSFQMSPNNSSHSKDGSIQSLTLQCLPFTQRRGSTLSSSTTRLQHLIMKSNNNRRNSTGMPTFGGHKRGSIHSGKSAATSTSFSRRRTLERKRLFKTLEKALQITDTFADSDEACHEDAYVTFQLKKNSSTVVGFSPPNLSRSVSNSSASSNSGTLKDLLKESRRERLMDMLEKPESIRNLNTSSLRDSFHSVSAIGANQLKRLSSAWRQRELAKIAADAAAKAAATLAAFQQSVRDFSTYPAALALAQYNIDLQAPSSSSSSDADVTATLAARDKSGTTTLLHTTALSSTPELRKCFVSRNGKSRSMKDIRLVYGNMLNDSSSVNLQDRPSNAAIRNDKKAKQRQAMRRASSAPRNSFKSNLSSYSSGARSTSRSKQAAEIAALQALAGSSHTMRRRSSCSGNGLSIPASITILMRSSSSGSGPGQFYTKGLDSAAAKTPDVLLPRLARSKSSPEPTRVFSSKAGMNPPSIVNHKPRASVIAEHLACSSLHQQHHDSSMSDLSSATNTNAVNHKQQRRFQRMATFSARKSMSLMVQNASIQEDQVAVDTDTHRNNENAFGTNNSASALLMQRRQQRSNKLLRGGSSTSRNSNGGGTFASAAGEMNEKAASGGTTDNTANNRRAFMKRQASVIAGSRIRTLRN